MKDQMAILGSRAVGVEFASRYQHFGGEMTPFEPSPACGARGTPWRRSVGSRFAGRASNATLGEADERPDRAVRDPWSWKWPPTL
jgi:hypothetical protein